MPNKMASGRSILPQMLFFVWSSPFGKDMYTAVIFIDIKGLYDTFWREGLIYKLNSIGIGGRLLKMDLKLPEQPKSKMHD